MSTFCCPTRTEFHALRDAIADRVATDGYAVIEAWDAESTTLKEVSEAFGRVQTHIRADANGLVGISPDTIVNREWEKFRSEYHGVSTEEFLPHTDGSYLHGLVHQGDKYIELLPPKMLLLQCWQSAESGGANLLIDGQLVYQDLARTNPSDAKILSTKGCVTYCRDDQIAFDCAVFQPLPDGTMMLRFRYDATAYVADWAVEAFHALQRNYFGNARYQSRLSLTPGQILVVDNYRMLHGRDAFSSSQTGKVRSMRRVWLAYDRLGVLCNAVGEHREKRALQRFKAYDILPPAPSYATAATLDVGIRLAA
jgi:alpha-ketoglutarate-dependent taurine dioxygenase